jgi:hypothetical protein
MRLDDDTSGGSWLLIPAEHALVMAKNSANRLGFALLLLFYRDLVGSRQAWPRSTPKPWRRWRGSLAWSRYCRTGTSWTCWRSGTSSASFGRSIAEEMPHTALPDWLSAEPMAESDASDEETGLPEEDDWQPEETYYEEQDDALS